MNAGQRVLRSLGVWWNAALLAAFSFAGDIVQALNEHLPSLAMFLPANVYKWVGLVVVVLNIVGAVRRARAKEKAHG